MVVYACRPGYRLWLANKLGIVQQTLIFKSAIQSTCPKIQLINPVEKKQLNDTNFGKVLQFGDNKLVTFNSEVLYVLHPGAVSVMSVLYNVRKILDLAVNDNEIFILEGERSLLRISPVPDTYELGKSSILILTLVYLISHNDFCTIVTTTGFERLLTFFFKFQKFFRCHFQGNQRSTWMSSHQKLKTQLSDL